MNLKWQISLNSQSLFLVTHLFQQDHPPKPPQTLPPTRDQVFKCQRLLVTSHSNQYKLQGQHSGSRHIRKCHGKKGEQSAGEVPGWHDGSIRDIQRNWGKTKRVTRIGEDLEFSIEMEAGRVLSETLLPVGLGFFGSPGVEISNRQHSVCAWCTSVAEAPSLGCWIPLISVHYYGI